MGEVGFLELVGVGAGRYDIPFLPLFSTLKKAHLSPHEGEARIYRCLFPSGLKLSFLLEARL